jgi:hypothetical protein
MISIYAVPKHPDGPKWRVVIDGGNLGLGIQAEFFDNHDDALAFVQAWLGWLDTPVPM